MAQKANIVIDQGADFYSEVQLDTGSELPVSYDLTGHDILAQMRKWHTSTNYIEFTSEIVDAANGTFSMSLSSDITKDITPGRYVYDAIIIDAANTVTRAVEGIATVSYSTTKR